jgi:hypothetical protein
MEFQSHAPIRIGCAPEVGSRQTWIRTLSQLASGKIQSVCGIITVKSLLHHILGRALLDRSITVSAGGTEILGSGFLVMLRPGPRALLERLLRHHVEKLAIKKSKRLGLSLVGRHFASWGF